MSSWQNINFKCCGICGYKSLINIIYFKCVVNVYTLNCRKENITCTLLFFFYFNLMTKQEVFFTNCTFEFPLVGLKMLTLNYF